MKRESGSISLAALGALALSAAFAGAVALLFGQGVALNARSMSELRASEEALNAVKAVIESLEHDDDPDSDSVFDAARAIGSISPAMKASLHDVSSRLNPNFLRKNIIEKSRLAFLMLPGSTPAALQQRREDEGLAIDIESAYSSFFPANSLRAYFTPYSYGCVNADDEFALRRLYFEATGERSSSESFHAALQRQLVEKRNLKRGELESYFGAALIGPVMDVVSAEAQVNANMADPWVLETLFSYQGFSVSDPASAAAAVVRKAEQSEITAAGLASLLGKPKDAAVFSYIGTKTWFWKMDLEAGGIEYEAVMCRSPRDASKNIRLIRFSRKDDA